MSEKTDHDLIVAHSVKIDQVCKTLHKVDGKLDKLNDKLDENIKTFVTVRVFSMFVGILFILICGSYGYAKLLGG